LKTLDSGFRPVHGQTLNRKEKKKVKIEGKTAVVTGGGAGIGEGIAVCLAEEGADVAVIDINKEGAARVAERVSALGRRSLAKVADFTDSKQVNQTIKEILDTFGKIDILVNNVGGEARFYRERSGLRFVEIGEEEWDENLDLNLKSTIIACQAVVPHLVKQRSGKIVNVSSTAGRPPAGLAGGSPSPLLMAYSVAKAGVIRFTQGLALELAEYNINVNCVCPMVIWTPMMEKNAIRAIQTIPEARGMTPREYYEKFIVSKVPLKRETTVADVGHAVVFFVSEDSRNISGQTINVDGGSRPS
jgi:meso-butanediol dehydrogenase / (S,S)-butanediol dehydrogenase / diacetyl reductase